MRLRYGGAWCCQIPEKRIVIRQRCRMVRSNDPIDDEGATSMQRISSRGAFLFKRVAPIYLGLAAIFIVVAFVAGNVIILFPILALVIGFVWTKEVGSRLVDEVWSAGDALVIRNKGQEERIPLSTILNVQLSWIRPPIVTLTLGTPSVFGDTITFLAPHQFFPFTRRPIIDDLIRRVDDARMRAPST
jgi:hypothetical protein